MNCFSYIKWHPSFIHWTRFLSVYYVCSEGSPSWACDLGNDTGSYAQKDPVFGLMLCCQHLEMVNHFALTLVFCKVVREVQCRGARTRTGDESRECVLCLQPTPVQPSRHPMSRELQGTHAMGAAQGDSSQCRRERCQVHDWRVGCPQAGEATPSIQRRAGSVRRKKAVTFEETQMTKEPYHILCYWCYVPINQCLGWKWLHGRKGKDRAAASSLSLQPCLSHQWPEAECWGGMAHVRRDRETSEFIHAVRPLLP